MTLTVEPDTDDDSIDDFAETPIYDSLDPLPDYVDPVSVAA